MQLWKTQFRPSLQRSRGPPSPATQPGRRRKGASSEECTRPLLTPTKGGFPRERGRPRSSHSDLPPLFFPTISPALQCTNCKARTRRRRGGGKRTGRSLCVGQEVRRWSGGGGSLTLAHICNSVKKGREGEEGDQAWKAPAVVRGFSPSFPYISVTPLASRLPPFPPFLRLDPRRKIPAAAQNITTWSRKKRRKEKAGWKWGAEVVANRRTKLG